MKRVAAGAGLPYQSSIGSPGAPGAGAAPEAGATLGAAAPRPRLVAGDLGSDRPAVLSAGGTGRAPASAQTFLSDLKRWEGEHRFMYVDTGGHVTTGIGHLLTNRHEALKLPWRHSGTGLPATPAEIKSAFTRVCQTWTAYKHHHPDAKGIPLRQCEKVSDLVLPEGYSTKLAVDRLNNEFLPHLRRLCPGFDGYPMPAQRALVDMAYNLGGGKLAAKFPKLIAACRLSNFALAACESERSSSRLERNVATRELFVQAAQLDASVRTIIKQIRL